MRTRSTLLRGLLIFGLFNTIQHYGVAASRSVAPGWLLSPEAQDYEVGVDHTNTHQGLSSITLRSLPTATPTSHVAIGQHIKADDYRGKRIRLRGYVKTDNVQGKARLWLRADGPEGVLAIDAMNNRALIHTRQWQRMEIVLAIPMESTGIIFGVRLSGTGQVWMDDVQFEVVPDSTSMTRPNGGKPTSRHQTPEQIQHTLTMYTDAPSKPHNLGFETLPVSSTTTP